MTNDQGNFLQHGQLCHDLVLRVPAKEALLQQAYDRAMAHNAMLRAALEATAEALELNRAQESAPCESVQPYGDNLNLNGFRELYQSREALNATEADAEAWLSEYVKRVMGWTSLPAQGTHTPKKSSLQQQLATVTNERDALRETLVVAIDIAEADLGYCSLSDEFLEAQKLWRKTLTQSPPSE